MIWFPPCVERTPELVAAYETIYMLKHETIAKLNQKIAKLEEKLEAKK